MSNRRPITEKNLSEARTREHRYDALQKKTTKDPDQLHLGFDAKPPSRNDAQHLVDERRKERASSVKPKAKSVPKPKKGAQTSTPLGEKQANQTKHHAPPLHSSNKSKQSGKTTTRKKHAAPSSTKKPRKKKSSKKKKSSSKVSVHIPVPFFIASVIVVALILGSLVAWQIVGFRPFGGSVSEVRNTEPISVTIDPGMTARSISRLLESRGIVSDAKAFEQYLEVQGSATRLQSGTFVLDPGLSHALIAETLLSPPTLLHEQPSITIFAGSTISDIDSQLAALGYAPSGAFSDAAFLLAEDRGLPFAEGWFLSGSYTLEVSSAVSMQLAATMQDAFNEAVRPYFSALDELGISLTDGVIIASMIQRETNSVLQMADIAGVIYNRLRSDMPLGLDASLRYGIEAWDRPLSVRETQSTHPYNTRRVKGLPPTGIGCSSLAAIDAAMNPSSHDWYYYIHDKQGEIHFAKTYDEHNENIARYLE